MSTESKPESPAKASEALVQLGRALVGSWRFSGDTRGTTRYGWAEGGLFLEQHVNLEVFGKSIRGIEMIGHIHRVGEKPSEEVWSRFYSYKDGLTLDYVYELKGRRLTIWFMRKDSDNFFSGSIAEDGSSYEGAWAWPGGGYHVTAVREESAR
jgi:hypothetical protein